MSEKKPVEKYFEVVVDLLSKIKDTQGGSIEKAAQIMADAIQQDRVIYAYGPGGHSHMGVEEMFSRAGGLVPVYPIMDPGVSVIFGGLRSSFIERTPGYARALIRYHRIGEGDVLVLTTAYGINAVTIDAALEAKEREATVIAITSPAFQKSTPPDLSARHPSKKNLYEIADIVIDCFMPPEDAVLQFKGMQQKVSPVSTILLAFCIECLVAEAVNVLLKRGVTPPVWMSANIPGGDKFNKKWIDEYFYKIKYL